MLVVSREIPIKVVSKKFWAEYKEPLMPKFNMSIFMPSLGKVRSMIDKIKNPAVPIKFVNNYNLYIIN